MPRIILVIYLLVGLVNVATHFYDITDLNVYTKPFLMPLLIFYLYRYASGHITLPRLILVGVLIFSWIGDLLLMGGGDSYFMAGLLAFLIAQIGYSFALYQSTFGKPKLRFINLIPLVIYGVILLNMLWSGMDQVMQIGILVYALGILTMVFVASIRLGFTNNRSYVLVLLGSSLFVLSDSLIALNKFYIPIPHDDVLIMSTYIAAQLLLVRGILLHEG